MSVEENDNQVDEVYREREIGYKFGTRNEYEKEYNTGAMLATRRRKVKGLE